jgi:hypothetical protein
MARCADFSSRGIPFVLYGDQSYPSVSGLVAPFRGEYIEPWQIGMNVHMYSVCEAVKHGYKDINTNWAYVDFKKFAVGGKILHCCHNTFEC